MNSRKMLVDCYKIGQALAQNQSVRQLGTSGARQAVKGEVAPGYSKIVEKYRHFQRPDDTPVHLKGGTFDYFMYYSTLALCVGGLAGCLHFYYSCAFPPRKE